MRKSVSTYSGKGGTGAIKATRDAVAIFAQGSVGGRGFHGSRNSSRNRSGNRSGNSSSVNLSNREDEEDGKQSKKLHRC